MVFRGKPSKACQRCRERKLRCDLKKPQCSSCLRASYPCTGYRNTELIRFKHETDITCTKAIARSTNRNKQTPPPDHVSHLPQDLQATSRDMFFAHYVSDFSQSWDFCFSYQNQHTSPAHLNLIIDAVSLAFLAHRVSSLVAEELGRRRYIDALRKLNKALQNPSTTRQMSTFHAVLLLDLYEKLSSPATSVGKEQRNAHIEGALALLKLKGVHTFPPESSIRMLLNLSINATICALSSGRPIPDEVKSIRSYASHFVDTTYPKWRLSSVIVEVPNHAAALHAHGTPVPTRIAKSLDLDAKLEDIALSAAPAWTYTRTFASTHDPRISLLPDFPVYDIYENRMVTQMFNVLRVTRILLCEAVLEAAASLPATTGTQAQCGRATRVVEEMAREICASAPQMTNCEYAARHKLSEGEAGKGHAHTMSHVLDVYVLIYALYVVTWARHAPGSAREWAKGQLGIIAEHFGVREAGVMLGLLRDGEGVRVEEEEVGGKRHTWGEYRMIGSYAFAAS